MLCHHWQGLIQSVFELHDGSGVAVTVGKYVTPNHKDINGNGIEPDFKNFPGRVNCPPKEWQESGQPHLTRMPPYCSMEWCHWTSLTMLHTSSRITRVSTGAVGLLSAALPSLEFLDARSLDCHSISWKLRAWKWIKISLATHEFIRDLEHCSV